MGKKHDALKLKYDALASELLEDKKKLARQSQHISLLISLAEAYREHFDESRVTFSRLRMLDATLKEFEDYERS